MSNSLLYWLKIDPVEFKKRRVPQNELAYKINNNVKENFVRGTHSVRRHTIIDYSASVSVGNAIGYTGLFGGLELARELAERKERNETVYEIASEFQIFNWANAVKKEISTDRPFKTVLASVQHDFYDKHYGDIRIFVFTSTKWQACKRLYAGPMNPLYKKYLYVYVDKNGHFSVITDLKKFFFSKQKSRYCIECNQFYQNSFEHNMHCLARCKGCFRMSLTKKCEMTNLKICDSCRRLFMNDECFEYHVKMGLCQKHRVCKKCNEEILKDAFRKRTKGGHVCGEQKCFSCYTYHLPISACVEKRYKEILCRLRPC